MLIYAYISSNDTPDPITSGALNAVFGKPCPVDLVEVSLPRQKLYSFLSVGWGLISDIDIESEGLRFIGDSRFVLWSIYRSFGRYIFFLISIHLLLFIKCLRILSFRFSAQNLSR